MKAIFAIWCPWFHHHDSLGAQKTPFFGGSAPIPMPERFDDRDGYEVIE